MKAVEELSPQLGTAAACRSLGVPRATLYRRRRPKLPVSSAMPRPKPLRTLSDQERQQVLDVLHSEPFADKAPAEIYATLLDQKRYLCSIRTMYRILEDQQEVRERRDQLRRPNYPKPQLVATGPNQVWSWDITKLLGPAKWTYYYLYVILDIFSRYVAGWMPAHRESEHLAERLIRETVLKEGIVRDQLTIHSDRGPSMRSQTVAQLLATLGITLLTPAMVHLVQAEAVLTARQAVLTAAHVAHPERFVRQPPRPLALPCEVWINPPADGPEPRMLQLPRDTNFVPQLSQTG